MKKGILVVNQCGQLCRVYDYINKDTVYLEVLTGEQRGGLIAEYESSLIVIKDSEDVRVY